MKSKKCVPAISVIIPVYNAEEYISECIDSVLRQSFRDFELILIDDASTDASWEICQKYCEYDNVRLYRHDMNRGSAITKNDGKEYAKGKYLAYIDCDDVVLPEYLMKLYVAAEKHSADVVRMGHVYYEMDSHTGRYVPTEKWVRFSPECQLSPDIYTRMDGFCKEAFWPTQWGAIFLRDFLIGNEIRFEDTFSDDVLFHFAVLYYSGVYVFIPDALYEFRLTPKSISRGADLQKSGKALASVVHVMRYAKKYIEKMDKINTDTELVDRIYHTFFRGFFRDLYGASIKGLPFEDVRCMSYEVFQEVMPEDAEFASCLFEAFLRSYYKFPE